MSNYVNWAGGWQKIEGEDGVEGREVYIENDHGGSAFPTITLGSTGFYDQVGGTTIANCIATRIETSFDDGDTGTTRKTVVYSSKRGGAGAGAGIKDTAQQRYDVGCEVITVDQKTGTSASKWTWKNGGADVNQPVHRNIAVGHFTLSVIKKSKTDAENYFSTLLGLVGKISNAALTADVVSKIDKGAVLFLGASGGTRRNATGELEWAWDLNFAYRVIPMASIDTSIGAWNYLFRNDTDANGGWDVPVLGTAYMYQTASLNALL